MQSDSSGKDSPSPSADSRGAFNDSADAAGESIAPSGRSRALWLGLVLVVMLGFNYAWYASHNRSLCGAAESANRETASPSKAAVIPTSSSIALSEADKQELQSLAQLSLSAPKPDRQGEAYVACGNKLIIIDLLIKNHLPIPAQCGDLEGTHVGELTTREQVLAKALTAYETALKVGDYSSPGGIPEFAKWYCREELAAAGGSSVEKYDGNDPWSYEYLFRRGDLELARFMSAMLVEHMDSVYGKAGGGNFAPYRDDTWKTMLSKMGMKAGAVVADIGGGTGRLAWLEKRTVGSQGRVYLSDIDGTCEDFLKYAGDKYPELAQLKQVKFITGQSFDPMLPEKVQYVTFSEVHLLQDQGWDTFGKKLLTTLRAKYMEPGGVLGIYERHLNCDNSIYADSAKARQKIIADNLSEVGFEMICCEPIAGAEQGLMVISRAK